jgi:uncharacterized protein
MFGRLESVVQTCYCYLMKPSQILRERRSDILATASKYPVRNLRIFGSVLHGFDTEKSDIDLLVDALPGTSLFDLGGLQEELEEQLGIKVDLRTPGDLSKYFRDKVLAEAKPI